MRNKLMPEFYNTHRDTRAPKWKHLPNCSVQLLAAKRLLFSVKFVMEEMAPTEAARARNAVDTLETLTK